MNKYCKKIDVIVQCTMLLYYTLKNIEKEIFIQKRCLKFENHLILLFVPMGIVFVY